MLTERVSNSPKLPGPTRIYPVLFHRKCALPAVYSVRYGVFESTEYPLMPSNFVGTAMA